MDHFNDITAGVIAGLISSVIFLGIGAIVSYWLKKRQSRLERDPILADPIDPPVKGRISLMVARWREGQQSEPELEPEPAKPPVKERIASIVAWWRERRQSEPTKPTMKGRLISRIEQWQEIRQLEFEPEFGEWKLESDEVRDRYRDEQELLRRLAAEDQRRNPFLRKYRKRKYTKRELICRALSLIRRLHPTRGIVKQGLAKCHSLVLVAYEGQCINQPRSDLLPARSRYS